MKQGDESLNIKHRLASPGDFDAVFDLHMDDTSNRYLTYDPMDRDEFRPVYHDLLKTNTLYVAEKNNQIIASYRLIPKENRQSQTIYLGGFVIKSNLKGKGLGSKILEHIKKEAASGGKKRIELTVDLKNEAAINLYKKLGFEIEGVVRMSYRLKSTNEYFDEYLMGLLL